MIRGLRAFCSPRVIVLGVGEVLVIAICFVLATFLRLGGEAYFELNYQGGFFKIALVCFVCFLSLYFYDLYDSGIFANRRELVIRTPEVIGTATIVLALLYYVYPPLGLGRGIFVLGLGLLCFGMLGYRLTFIKMSRTFPFAENTLLLGDGPFARELAQQIQARPEYGLRFVGLVSENGCNPSTSACDSETPVVGTIEDLNRSVAEHGVRRVIVALQDRRGKLPVTELLRLKAGGVAIEEGISFYESLSGKLAVGSLTPGWLIFSEGFAVSPVQRVFLRTLSVGLTIIGLLLAGPLMLLLALLIKLDSRGPALFRQDRVGKGGQIFRLFKFRSMYEGAEAETGPVWAQENDPRITRMGRLMRKWRLDELPQFFNVLRGDMNLVGPRPERPWFVEHLRQKIPFYDYRHGVKPGITGWAQIKYHYADSELSAMEKLQYDLFYCKNRSVGLDLLILFHTAKIVVLQRGSR